jgi:hypothetical protein
MRWPNRPGISEADLFRGYSGLLATRRGPIGERETVPSPVDGPGRPAAPPPLPSGTAGAVAARLAAQAPERPNSEATPPQRIEVAPHDH